MLASLPAALSDKRRATSAAFPSVASPSLIGTEC